LRASFALFENFREKQKITNNPRPKPLLLCSATVRRTEQCTPFCRKQKEGGKGVNVPLSFNAQLSPRL